MTSPKDEQAVYAAGRTLVEALRVYTENINAAEEASPGVPVSASDAVARYIENDVKQAIDQFGQKR